MKSMIKSQLRNVFSFHRHFTFFTPMMRCPVAHESDLDLNLNACGLKLMAMGIPMDICHGLSNFSSVTEAHAHWTLHGNVLGFETLLEPDYRVMGMAVFNEISGVQEQNIECVSVPFYPSVHFKYVHI